jgi:hypothetical protein
MSEEDLAATKIQAQFRGAGVRKSMNGAAEQDSGDGELLTKGVVTQSVIIYRKSFSVTI